LEELTVNTFDGKVKLKVTEELKMILGKIKGKDSQFIKGSVW
jgi:hypothetical protein